MSILAIQRDWGADPSIVRIVTNDTYLTITTPGYLTAQAANIAAIQNTGSVGFQWVADDVVLIAYLNSSGVITTGFFNVDFTVNFTFVSMQGSPLNTNYVRVPIGLAAFLANYTTPNLIIPAIPGQIIFVQQWALEWIYGSASLAAGGAEALQYANTTHGGGVLASNTIAAADLNSLTASGIEYSAGGVAPINDLTVYENVGIYLSNPTALFTGGTAGSALCHVWYNVITP